MSNPKATASSELIINYDPESQLVNLQFDPERFKTWDFVLAVLEMARLWTEQKKREAILIAMQKEQDSQAQFDSVRRFMRDQK